MKNKIIKSIQKQAQESASKWKHISIDKCDNSNLPLLNRRCMYNAWHEYKAGRSVAIIEVVSLDNIAHYLSMDSLGNIYDTTLGYSWSGVKYKLSRYIHPENKETEDMGKVLNEFKDRLFNMASKNTLRAAKILNIKPEDCF